MRQVINGGLIGADLLFFAAMLAVVKPDTPVDVPLQVAVNAFACAIPLSVAGFIWASFDFAPPNAEGTLLGTRTAQFLESLGAIGTAVGVIAIVAHLSATAAIALGVTTVGSLVLTWLVVIVGLVTTDSHEKKMRGGAASAEDEKVKQTAP
jgi:hypothetical protein